MKNTGSFSNSINQMQNAPPEPDCFSPFFEATLTPHRSMPKQGLYVLLGVMALISAGYAAFLVAIGVWLAPLLLSLPPLAIWWAFRANNRAGLVYEHVSVSPLEVRIKHVTSRGEEKEFCCNPFRVRIETEKDEDYGVTNLLLYAEGKVVTIGGFLNPDDRTSFTSAFCQALHHAKTRGLQC